MFLRILPLPFLPNSAPGQITRHQCSLEHLDVVGADGALEHLSISDCSSCSSAFCHCHFRQTVLPVLHGTSRYIRYRRSYARRVGQASICPCLTAVHVPPHSATGIYT